MKLIIWIPGKPLLNGYKRREYCWSEPHGCYIYKGRELGPEEFNAEFAECFKRNSSDGSMTPRVRVVDSTPSVIVRPEPVTERIITVEQAETVLQEHAPHRLKKKPGPTPAQALEVG